MPKSDQNVQNSLAAINAASVKLTAFWTAKPETWFSQIEAQFALKGITIDTTKYHHVVQVLNADIATWVSDVINYHPSTHKYEAIKSALLREYSLEPTRAVNAILEVGPAGAEKPSTGMA